MITRQVYAMIGALFPSSNRVSAFSIFQLTQGLGSMVGFVYALPLPLHGPDGTLAQPLILAATAVLSAVLFHLAARRQQRDARPHGGAVK